MFVKDLLLKLRYILALQANLFKNNLYTILCYRLPKFKTSQLVEAVGNIVINVLRGGVIWIICLDVGPEAMLRKR